MELRPRQPVPPFDGVHAGDGVSRVELPQQVDVVVGRHARQDLGGRLGRLGVHVAPPVDGLDAAVGAQATVVAQDGPQLGVDPSLYHVVRRRQRPLCGQLGVEVGEQRALVEQPDQRAPRLPEAPVGVLPAPVDQRPLVEEVGPEPAPAHEPLRPQVGLVERPYAEQVLRQAVQLDASLEPRPARRAPPHLGEHVEQASLDLGPGPALGRGLGEPAAAVRYHHVRRRYPGEQRLPSPRRLGSGEVPGEHVGVAAGDEHDDVPGEVYPVDVHDAVHLVHHVRHGPDGPEAGREPAEAPAPAGHVPLRRLAEQPPEKGVEVPRRRVVAVDGARPAALAAPSLRPRARPAVALHGPAARRAFHRFHQHPREQ